MLCRIELSVANRHCHRRLKRQQIIVVHDRYPEMRVRYQRFTIILTI